MSKVSCNVFRDLLPLYIDEIVSEDTRQLVNAHLQECAACRKNYEELSAKITIPIEKNDLPLKRIKQTWNRKKIALVCITLIAALLILISGMFAVEEFVYKEQIAFNGSVYTLEKSIVPTLPENCESIGYLMGIAFWSKSSPTADYMATNLDGKYGGCPLYQDPENTSVIYLEDFSGFYLPFHITETVDGYR